MNEQVLVLTLLCRKELFLLSYIDICRICQVSHCCNYIFSLDDIWKNIDIFNSERNIKKKYKNIIENTRSITKIKWYYVVENLFFSYQVINNFNLYENVIRSLEKWYRLIDFQVKKETNIHGYTSQNCHFRFLLKENNSLKYYSYETYTYSMNIFSSGLLMRQLLDLEVKEIEKIDFVGYITPDYLIYNSRESIKLIDEEEIRQFGGYEKLISFKKGSL